jgi:lysozyme
MTEPQGIDISNIQGARWPWAAERGKIGFGMAKATEGMSFTDPDFAANWEAMLQLSRLMPRFAYCFFHPSEDPRAQAQRFVATVQAQGLLRGDNFVMDLEANDGRAPEIVAAQGIEFLRCVNDLAPGHRVLVYTYPAFAKAGNCAGMESWYLWIANYEVGRPAIPAPWTRWTFWQTGEAPVDTDVFNGTEAQLLEFCRMPKSR